MKPAITLRALALVMAIVLPATATPLIADDTDILGTGMIAPNVMIMLDSSGSMNNSIAGGRKIDIAKAVVTDLVSTTPGVRFGVMKFGPGGAAMVSEIGTPPATIVSEVNSMTTSSVGTPLGDMADDGGAYFRGAFGSYASPIDLECRPNIMIVVSDGLENSTTLTLPDVTTDLHTVDQGTAVVGDQFLTVHTVGFAIPPGDAAAANSFLQQSASNGGGNFYSTTNSAELSAGLRDAIATSLSGAFAFASVSAPSTSTTGSDRLYQGSIEADGTRPFWRGRLQAFQRDASGRVPTDPGGVPLASARVWDAGALLAARAPSTRTIYTSVAGTRQSFVTGNAAITSSMLGVAGSERDALIEFIRGVDTTDEDGDGNTSEARDWPLGDILHSQPVLVSPPLLISRDPDYQAFRSANAARTSVLLVGANDGMLHAFRESDGVELWSYIPPDMLDRLDQLRPTVGTHPYFVDSSPVVADVRIGGAYRTIVVFGERRGGRSYHALDVTDTTSPVPLWSRTDARFGETWSVPAIGTLSVNGTPTDVVLVGGGYDTANNNATGSSFFVINATTGAIIWSYENDGNTDDRRFMNYSLAATPTALDLDGNGLVDRVYIGDVGGQLWKFDLSDATVSNWSGKRLFTAVPGQANPPAVGAWNPAQAIYAAPSATLDAIGSLWLFFGTGDLNNPSNASSNRLYGLRDTTTMANGSALSESSMADVTTTDATGGNGWYVRLSSTEKVFKAADVFDGSVFFTSFTPAAATTCTSGAGPARLYAMRIDSGYAAYDWDTGERLDPTDSSKARATAIGTGIPGDPRIVSTVVDGVLETTIITSTSERQLDDQDLPAIALRRLLYWREIY